MAAEAKQRAPMMIRTMCEDDISSVTEILRAAPEAVFWPDSSVREVLQWEGAVALVSEIDGRMVGFLIGRQAADEAEILNLAVERGSRRKGEGGALLNAAVEGFRQHGVKRVFLEVRESNQAGISFYKKHGFTEAGRRVAYYRDPDEAAVVMEKNLSN
jgi:ribosomal-protein-alanine N-acetyltransferase